MEIDHGEQHLIARVAAIDIGKAEMVCCVRVPGTGRARAQEVRTYSTMTPSVLEMAGLPHDFRTRVLGFQAASWGLLWRSRISCGVLYPNPE